MVDVRAANVQVPCPLHIQYGVQSGSLGGASRSSLSFALNRTQLKWFRPPDQPISQMPRTEGVNMSSGAPFPQPRANNIVARATGNHLALAILVVEAIRHSQEVTHPCSSQATPAATSGGS